jgi:hypothetical protein
MSFPHLGSGAEPRADEIRAAVERIVASDMLRNSPQLIAILRFIVERTLCGQGDRIKGYTIGVEALGRCGRRWKTIMPGRVQRMPSLSSFRAADTFRFFVVA